MINSLTTWWRMPPRNTNIRGALWFTMCLGLILGLHGSLLAQEIAILKSADISAYTEAIQGFKSHLPPSAHITLEYDFQGDMAKGRNLARRIGASHPKVVLAVGLKAALAAKVEIPDIPVIFCLVLDPKKYGLPGNNMVGLSLHISVQEQVKPLKILLPKVSRLGVLFDPQKTAGLVNQLKQEAKGLGLTILSQEVRSEQDIPKALHTLSTSGIDALWLLPDSTVLTENSLDFLMSWTLERNIPVVGFSAGLVKRGALVAVHLNYSDIGQQAANLVKDMFQNAQSFSLGTIVIPDNVHWAINLKTAKYLRLSPYPELLRQFDERF